MEIQRYRLGREWNHVNDDDGVPARPQGHRRLAREDVPEAFVAEASDSRRELGAREERGADLVHVEGLTSGVVSSPEAGGG